MFLDLSIWEYAALHVYEINLTLPYDFSVFTIKT